MSNHSAFRRNFLKGITLGSAALMANSALGQSHPKNNDPEFKYPQHFYDTIPALGIHQAGIITDEFKLIGHFSRHR